MTTYIQGKRNEIMKCLEDIIETDYYIFGFPKNMFYHLFGLFSDENKEIIKNVNNTNNIVKNFINTTNNYTIRTSLQLNTIETDITNNRIIMLQGIHGVQDKQTNLELEMISIKKEMNNLKKDMEFIKIQNAKLMGDYMISMMTI